jgi:hypothetical protein
LAVAHSFDAIPALAAILTEHGPLPEDDLGQRLRQAGVSDPGTVLVDLLDELSCPARELLDGRWAWLPAVLDGRVFTHRLTADEVAHDLLAVTPDLDPITELCHHEEYQQLADGSPIEVVLPAFDVAVLEERGIDPELVAESGALLLAEGTLAALAVVAGDLVGLRLTEQGLVVEPVTAVADSRVGAQLAGMLDADEPVYFDVAVHTVCAEDPAAFTTPLAPLSEIADEHGLARDDEWLAVGGFDFFRWNFERACARLARRYDLDSDDAFALHTLIQLHGQLERLVAAGDAEDIEDAEGPADDEVSGVETEPTDGGFAELIGKAASALADPLLAEVLMEETVGTGRPGAAALGMLAETLEPKVPRAARVATRWLHAVALERLGDMSGAERELLAAESLNPDWPLPLLDLARIASDRGDAEAGLALLHRAGAGPDHPLMQLLERHRVAPRNDLGRNEPCWCGSGRKYKKCHLRNEQLPLGERVGWLYAKANQHVLLGDWRELLFHVGYERGRYTSDDTDSPLAAALRDPLAMDAVLFEGGAFEDFVEQRGWLLPDDERLLAQQWLLVERSVLEVQQVRPGRGVTVRDVRTGDVHEVTERTASRTLQPGQLICARVVPAGDVMEFFGGIEPVALHQRDQLIELLDDEPDPVTLVAYLSRRFAPPTLVNTEGEPMAVCEARVQVSDPAAIAAELDATYERHDEELRRWFEFVTTDGMQRIRATLSLDGDTVQVETNSENRLDRALAVLHRLDPALRVLDDTRTPMGDVRQAAALAAQQPAVDPEPEDEDPELLAYMEQMIRQYEDRWLDEPIPALSGVTPRQAAEDPTRRDDLIKLLNSFPTGVAAGRGMDADRLRAALGLT